MSKSRDAFRTISEVSDMLDTPAHVLRFWESKFAQVKPVKRAGGRRYYRPTDVDLLAGIKQLLHEDGMTIKGAQKLLREQGVKHVAAMGDAVLSATTDAPVDVTPAPVEEPPAEPTVVETAPTPEPEVEVEVEVAAEATAPPPDTTPEAEVGITNVVPMAPSAPANTGPALSLNLAPKADDAPAAAPDISGVPSDPTDSDSKAPARIFHLIQNADADKLNAQALAIAPLLDRMQVLRDRVASR